MPKHPRTPAGGVARYVIDKSDGALIRSFDGPLVYFSDYQHLQARVEELEKERDQAIKRKEFCEQWYAERIRRIKDTAKRENIWPEIACILANGTAGFKADGSYEYEPPTYAQILNVAKWSAEALRDQLDEASSRQPELEDLASLLERDSSAETSYNVAQSLSALADVLGALPQRAIGQHDEIEALHDRADQAEQRLIEAREEMQRRAEAYFTEGKNRMGCCYENAAALLSDLEGDEGGADG